MRTINPNALAYVNQQYGLEPANIIKFEFGSYCDKEIEQVSGKILELSDLDSIINIDDSSNTSEITVTLDDTDGTIKTYMQSNDLHLTDATVYQWFDGLDFDDRFILFKGQVNTPVVWDEGARTITLTIISKLEDVEIGFSPEEGQFTGLGQDYVGKAWPMCFGEIAQVDALQLNEKMAGVVAEGFGMVDKGLIEQVRIASAMRATGNFNAQDITTWTPEMCLAIKLLEQQATVKHGIDIFNGERFPRGTIWLDFGTCIVEGYFTGFHFTFTSEPQYNPRSGSTVGFCGMDGSDNVCGSAYSAFIDGQTGETGLTKEEICNGIAAMAASQAKIPLCGFLYVAPGTAVGLVEDEALYYAVSCVPGTIKGVSSYINTSGRSFLQNVDESLWSQEDWDLGNGQTGVILKINNALSKQVNPLLGISWDDHVFVNFESTIGPNTAEIIDYIITHYSNKTIANYDSVRDALVNYPSDFAIYSRPNIIDAIQNIAWQARCSIILKNDEFILTYLPAEQPSRDTITEADILEDTLTIELTSTEDVITKMECLWEATGTQLNPNKIILRNNIGKYGTKSENFDFYIYNFVDAVLKSATYWMNKYSSTWKRVKFETPITKLALETMDYVTLNLSSLANEPVLAVIEEATYNSNNHSIMFTCLTPVKAGTMEQYIYAYPAAMDPKYSYPDPIGYDEWLANYAINKDTQGELDFTGMFDYVKRTTPDPYNNEPEPDRPTVFADAGFPDLDRRWTDRMTRWASDLRDRHPGFLTVYNTPVMSQPDEVH